MKILVLNKQTFFDISLITTGVSDNALKIAEFNSLNPSDGIPPGTSIEIPEGLTIDEQVKAYYQTYKLRPATDITQETIDLIIGCSGIGCWAIGVDFKVS